MGYNSGSTLALVTAILLTLNIPVARGQAIGNLVTGLDVYGAARCPPNGTSSALGSGLGGQTVAINCYIYGLITTVGQTVTGPDGSFNISIPTIAQPFPFVNSQIPCEAYMNVPLSSVDCPLLSALQGALTAAVVPINIIVNTFRGVLVTAITGIFS